MTSRVKCRNVKFHRWHYPVLRLHSIFLHNPHRFGGLPAGLHQLAFNGFGFPLLQNDSHLHPENYGVKTLAAPVTSLQFFPEGGDLVQQIESVVGFKATDTKERFGKSER